MINFDAIRPYNDSEINEVLRRIVASDECLDLIVSLRLPRLFALFPRLLRAVFRFYLRRKIGRIDNVLDFQRIVEGYIERMLEHSSSGLVVTGLEHISRQSPSLLISNHRDIALDPAVVGYALYHAQGATPRIAIGDNLLSKPFVADLMRANKSFIVERSLGGPRELLRALKTLSAYIAHSLHSDGESVWLAQREGRAKDGRDKTDPAVIKMLAIAKTKDEPFSNYIRRLRLLPVSVSYEYDPCDVMKARELRCRSQQGEYTKSAHEDLLSIGRGIAGDKGRIYLHFGEPMDGCYEDAAAVAAALDRAIVTNYRIQPTHVLAYIVLHGEAALSQLLAEGVLSEEEGCYTADDRERFHQHIAALSDEDTPYVLAAYANAIVHRAELSAVDAPRLSEG